MLSRKAKHLAYVTEILRSAQNDIHHLVCDRALVPFLKSLCNFVSFPRRACPERCRMGGNPEILGI